MPFFLYFFNLHPKIWFSFYFILEKEEGGERVINVRERNIDRLPAIHAPPVIKPATQVYALSKYQTHNLVVHRIMI